MADEVGSAALSAGQKAIEVGAELIKLLAPLAEKLISTVYHKSVDGIGGIGEKIADIRSKGTVTNKGLFIEAQKAGCGISTTSNVLSSDIAAFAEKAKQYNIAFMPRVMRTRYAPTLKSPVKPPERLSAR